MNSADKNLRPRILVLVGLMTVFFGSTNFAQTNNPEQMPGLPAVKNGSDEIDELKKDAFLHLKKQEWGPAAEKFKRLNSLSPNDGIGYYGYSLALFNLGEIDSAEANIGLAVRKFSEPAGNPLLADALVLSAVISSVRKKPQDAVESLKKALAIAPEHFDANFSMARALFGQGDLSGAAVYFEKSVALRPENTSARFFYGTVLERLDETEKALAEYRRILELNPLDFQGNLGLGVLLLKNSASPPDEGISALRRVISVRANSYEARVALGKALIKMKLYDEAVMHLRAAAEIASGNPEPHFQLSIAYRKMGMIEEAKSEAEIVKTIHENRRKISN